MSYQGQQQRTVLGTDPYLELNNQGKTLHLTLHKPQHVLGRDPSVADLVIPQDWELVSHVQAVLRKEVRSWLAFS